MSSSRLNAGARSPSQSIQADPHIVPRLDRRRADDLRAFRLLLLACWALVVVPSLVSTFAVNQSALAAGNADPSRLAFLAAAALGVVLVGTSAAIVFRRLDRLPRVGLLPLFLVVTPWLFQVMVGLNRGEPPESYTVAIPMIALAVWVLRPPVEALVLNAYLAAGVAILSIVMGVVLPQRGLLFGYDGQFSSPEKLLFGVAPLKGPLPHSNLLGMLIALGLPWMRLVRPGLRLLLGAPLIVALLWSASRTAISAVLLCAAFTLVIGRFRPPFRRRMSVLVMTALLIIGAIFPWIAIPREMTLSGRVRIWRLAADSWERSPVFGAGSRAFLEFTASEYDPGPALHGHNLLMTVGTTGGLVSFVFMLCLLSVAIRKAPGRGVAACSFLVTVLILAITETPFELVGRLFGIPTAIVPLFVILFAAPQRRRRRRPDLVTLSERIEIRNPVLLSN